MRRCHQLDAARVGVPATFAPALAEITREAAELLGVAGEVEAHLYKLLVYGPGDFFVPHRDTEKEPGMFGTLVITLPGDFTGGELVVRHGGAAERLPVNAGASGVRWVAFYADCSHEVLPLASGARVALIYNLVRHGVPTGPSESSAVVDALARELATWEPGFPVKLAWALEHRYSEAELGWDRLKGADHGRAEALRRAAAASGVTAHLAQLAVDVEWSAEELQYRSRRRRGGWGGWGHTLEDDEVPDDIELWDRITDGRFLRGFVDASGASVGLDAIPVEEGEVWPEGVIDDEPPDHVSYHEATGNEGATLTQMYRRAVVVLWPADAEDALLAQCGLEAVVSALPDIHDAARVERLVEEVLHETAHGRPASITGLIGVLVERGLGELGARVLERRVRLDSSLVPAVSSVLDVLDERRAAELASRVMARLGSWDGTAAVSVLAEAGDDASWSWLSEADPPVSLGRIELQGDSLTLETNSVERATRGRQLLEGAAGAALRFVVCSHEDLVETARRHLRDGTAPPEPPPGEDALPRELQERLVLEAFEQHYRGWVDEPVPALQGATPRAAAANSTRVEAVRGLIRGIEGLYQEALRADEPAYDPSWMWEELGLAAEAPEHPPPLAHERLYAEHPELCEAAGSLADRVRRSEGFEDRASLCRPELVEADLLVRRLEPEARESAAWLADFELHRRKVFWVSRALSWELAHSDLELQAGELRLPFPSLALAFTDRLALSLAERLVARERPDSAVAGHFGLALTVYVSAMDERLRFVIAVDTGGAHPPELIEHRMAPGAVGSEATPLRQLLELCVAAIAYATSPTAEARPRSAASPGPSRGPGAMPVSSDSVFFLPGTIDISRLREVEALGRAPGGRELMHRFLVRGHWRRPNPSWKDQRLRWITPYWKGPPVGAVIEKAYRLLP